MLGKQSLVLEGGLHEVSASGKVCTILQACRLSCKKHRYLVQKIQIWA